jgi:hypothetical protein
LLFLTVTNTLIRNLDPVSLYVGSAKVTTRLICCKFVLLLIVTLQMAADTKAEEKQITVNLKAQTLTATEDGKVKFTFPCVTGDKDHPTKPGKFTIYRKHEKYRSKKYDVEMPFSMFFSKDGKAIHAGLCCVEAESFLKSMFDDLGADRLGSHGCVRLSKDDAKSLFSWAENGTKVSIVKEE